MKTSKCLGDGTGMAAAPVQQALTSGRRSSVLYPELSLHIVNRRRATKATVSAHLYRSLFIIFTTTLDRLDGDSLPAPSPASLPPSLSLTCCGCHYDNSMKSRLASFRSHRPLSPLFVACSQFSVPSSQLPVALIPLNRAHPLSDFLYNRTTPATTLPHLSLSRLSIERHVPQHVVRFAYKIARETRPYSPCQQQCTQNRI